MQFSTLITLFSTSALVAEAARIPLVDIIEQIAPGSKSCADATAECRTAEQATPFIMDGMLEYGINGPKQIAAVLSLMAFESVDFRYKTNQFPGRPGQGTANMQMAEFNLKYAKQINEVAGAVANISSVEGLPDAELNRIRSLVTPDQYNFGSGPWFLVSECAPDLRKQIDEDLDAGFAAYMACVGVEVTEDRLAYLERAKAAMYLD